MTRAGVSGSAWASVWLPALLNGRRAGAAAGGARQPCRGTARAVVVERPAEATPSPKMTIGSSPTWPGRSAWRFTTRNSTRRSRRRWTSCASRQTPFVSPGRASGQRRRRTPAGRTESPRGAQQHLVALAVNLRLARDIIADDPVAGAEMLDELAGEVQETIQELRELAHGIYPPLLVDSGLVEALEAAASRNPLSVDVWRTASAAIVRDRGGGLLLLSGSPPKCGQARHWRRSGGAAVGGVGWAPVLGQRQRTRFRRGQGATWSRIRQHGRPPRGDRRDGPLGVRARAAPR